MPDNAGDLFAGEGASLGEEGLPIPEQEVGGLDPNWEQRAGAWNEKWKETISQLKDPVEIVPLVFVEPVASKRASVTLRAIQRVYTRIRLLNLGVRRLHSDSGREFANSLLERWALARDIAVTASVPSDPKSNGRVESLGRHQGFVVAKWSPTYMLASSCSPVGGANLAVGVRQIGG